MRSWSRDGVTFEQKATAGVLAFGALVVAGWLTADSLSSSSAHSGTTAGRATATVVTVTSVRTVRQPGPVVTEDVPVTNRVLVRSKPKVVTTTVVRTSTAFGTSTVYRNLPAPAAVTQVVTAPPRTVTRLVTTTQWRVITIAQKASTVTITVPAP
jgi:hypothetical protein